MHLKVAYEMATPCSARACSSVIDRYMSGPLGSIVSQQRGAAIRWYSPATLFDWKAVGPRHRGLWGNQAPCAVVKVDMGEGVAQ